jgi:hypothetical protein
MPIGKPLSEAQRRAIAVGRQQRRVGIWQDRRVSLRHDSPLRWRTREALVVFDRHDGYLTIRRPDRTRLERWHHSHFELIAEDRVVAEKRQEVLGGDAVPVLR